MRQSSFKRLSFRYDSSYQREDGTANLARLKPAAARLYLVRGNEPIVPSQQAELFSTHASDVNGLRQYLLARGLADGDISPGAEIAVKGAACQREMQATAVVTTSTCPLVDCGFRSRPLHNFFRSTQLTDQLFGEQVSLDPNYGNEC